MPTRLLSITDIAKESGVPRHRISYAIVTGRIREPRRLQNRRCFTARDLEEIKQYFSRDRGSK
jgi:DNA-binding transcriptional MerR regulator